MNLQLSTADAVDRVYTEEDIRAVADSWYAAAPEDFLIFRYLMRPSLLQAWWQQDVPKRLMQFFRLLQQNLPTAANG
jgi:hypothetical protein